MDDLEGTIRWLFIYSPCVGPALSLHNVAGKTAALFFSSRFDVPWDRHAVTRFDVPWDQHAVTLFDVPWDWQAVTFYQEAASSLGRRDLYPEVWDSVNLELAGSVKHSFRDAVYQLEHIQGL